MDRASRDLTYALGENLLDEEAIRPLGELRAKALRGGA
jgi:hypothetical protein